MEQWLICGFGSSYSCGAAEEFGERMKEKGERMK
jgi:hypothetical protein